MNSTFFIKLSPYKYFWKIRSWFIKTKFIINRNYYSIKYRIGDKKENASSLFELFRITISGLLLSILSVTILLIVDPFVEPLYKYFKINITQGEEYVSFFSTVAAIGGVFIGLYYAAISTVSATVYSQVANNIRDLLVKEKIGNVYMRYLSFVTFLSLLIITVRILFQIYIGVAVIFVIILSGIGIIAFVKLGQRAFYLFNPAVLSYTIFYEMRNYLKNVIVGGYKWYDPNFQSHANKSVEQNIDTLETLTPIVKKSPHLAGQPYFELVKNLMSFLIFYQNQKNKIPNNSLWFDIIYVHKNWYKTDETSLNIAYKTGTQLNPDKEFDYMWIENRLIPIINECIKINLEFNNREIVFSLMQYFERFIIVISENGDIDKAIKYLNTLEDSLTEAIKEKYTNSKSIKESLIVIGFYELLSATVLNIFLSFLKKFESLDREGINKKLKNIIWTDKQKIYNHGFPFFCTEHIQWLAERIEFEIKVEGKIITPYWYLTELLSLYINNKLTTNINYVLEDVLPR